MEDLSTPHVRCVMCFCVELVAQGQRTLFLVAFVVAIRPACPSHCHQLSPCTITNKLGAPSKPAATFTMP